MVSNNFCPGNISEIGWDQLLQYTQSLTINKNHWNLSLLDVHQGKVQKREFRGSWKYYPGQFVVSCQPFIFSFLTTNELSHFTKKKKFPDCCRMSCVEFSLLRNFMRKLLQPLISDSETWWNKAVAAHYLQKKFTETKIGTFTMVILLTPWRCHSGTVAKYLVGNGEPGTFSLRSGEIA